MEFLFFLLKFVHPELLLQLNFSNRAALSELLESVLGVPSCKLDLGKLS